MAKSVMNLQDSFLNQVRKDNAEITMVMLDGSKLSGNVRGFDNFTVILHAQGAQHLIYKHAIAQITVRRSHVPHGEGERRRRGGRGDSRQPAGDKKQPAAQAEKFNTIDLSSVQVEEAKNA